MFGKRWRDDDRDDERRPDDVRDHDRRGEGYPDEPREGGKYRGDSRPGNGPRGGPWGVPADQVDLWHRTGHGGGYQDGGGYQGGYQGSALEGPGDRLRPGPGAAPGTPPWEPAGDPIHGNARGRAGRDYRDAGFGGAGYGGAGYGSAGYGRAANHPEGGGHDAGPRNDSARNGSGRNGGVRDGGARDDGWEDDAYRAPTFTAAHRNGEYGRVPTFQPRVPEFSPAAEGAPGTHLPARDPRPYGRLSIFTLINEKEAEFDRLARRAAQGVSEPGTLAYVIHAVPQVPAQRIIYEIYRDRAAFEGHERQPHILQFAEERKALVLAVNIIDLRPEYANMVLTGAASPPPREQPPGPVIRDRRTPGPAGQLDGDGHYGDAGTGWRGDGAGPGYAGAGSRWDEGPRNGQYRTAVNGTDAGRGWPVEDWREPRGPGQRDGGNLHGAPYHPA